ncbi:NAD(P)H-binding protein [Nonomuraea angiospora]|uniref:NAD(P)H-binding protein n=1 Tax=Nonomuraea angiospora TaxID=46172 RepID=UPI0033D7B9BA
MILLTGTTSSVGRALLNNLLNQDDNVHFRVVTRNLEIYPYASFEKVQGDPSQPESLASALRDATALFIDPRATGDAVGDLVDLARRQGVRRLVTLSEFRGDDLSVQTPCDSGDRIAEAEDAVVASGLEWVILRVGFLASDTMRMWAGQIRSGDVVRGAFAEWSAAPIHEIDIAAVVARALLTDGLLGQKLALTGPQMLTQHEMVAAIGEAIGRPLYFQEILPEDARQDMIGCGLDVGFVDALLTAQAREVGRPTTATEEVERVLGRPAKTYARWAAHHRPNFHDPALA